MVVAAAEPPLPGRVWAAWAADWTSAIATGALVLALLYFPDGRLPSRRWRPAVWLLVLATGLLVAGWAFSPDLSSHPGVANPVGLELFRHPLLYQGGLGWILLPVAVLAAAASLVVRFLRAGAQQRQQLRWLAFAVGVLAAGFVATLFTYQQDRGSSRLAILLLLAGVLAVPVSVGIAILRHGLFDVGLVIRRSLLYGALSLLLWGLYAGGAALLGIAAVQRLPLELAVVLTVAVTLAIQPVRQRLDRLAEQLLSGRRLSGYQLLTRFGETLEHALDVAELTPRVAAAARDGLGLRWARVRLQPGAGQPSQRQPTGLAGTPPQPEAVPALSVPLVHATEQLGVIECGPKLAGPFTARDRELLATLARQAALGIHNAHLAAELSARLEEIRRQADELAASRARIVHAQEGERRRIERDLHDGVQQELVSLLTKIRLACNHLRRDPSGTDATLAELQAEAGQTLNDLRELARGIHPPVLTDRGLLEAIEARIARLPIGVAIRADPALRGARFPPQVEDGAYFFVCEALSNTLKHAAASGVVVRLARDGDHLVVKVEDDGAGFTPASATGSGLTGLRDRLEAVGGRLSVISQPGSGTRLVAELPAQTREPSGA